MTPAGFGRVLKYIAAHTICGKQHATKVTFPVFINPACFVICELAATCGKEKDDDCHGQILFVWHCLLGRLTLNNYDGDCGRIGLVS